MLREWPSLLARSLIRRLASKTVLPCFGKYPLWLTVDKINCTNGLIRDSTNLFSFLSYQSNVPVATGYIGYNSHFPNISPRGFQVDSVHPPHRFILSLIVITALLWFLHGSFTFVDKQFGASLPNFMIHIQSFIWLGALGGLVLQKGIKCMNWSLNLENYFKGDIWMETVSGVCYLLFMTAEFQQFAFHSISIFLSECFEIVGKFLLVLNGSILDNGRSTKDNVPPFFSPPNNEVSAVLSFFTNMITVLPKNVPVSPCTTEEIYFNWAGLIIRG